MNDEHESLRKKLEDLRKSINYQNNPVLGELVTPLLAGEHLYSGPETWGRDYLDLLIGGLYLTAYFHRPKLRYVMMGLLALSVGSLQFYLATNGQSLSSILTGFF